MRDLDKLIVAKGLKKLPKVQKIAQSCHISRNGFISYISVTHTLLSQVFGSNHSVRLQDKDASRDDVKSKMGK